MLGAQCRVASCLSAVLAPPCSVVATSSKWLPWKPIECALVCQCLMPAVIISSAYPVFIVTTSPSPLSPRPRLHCHHVPISIVTTSPSPLSVCPRLHCHHVPVSIVSVSPSSLSPCPRLHCHHVPISIVTTSPSPLSPCSHLHCHHVPVSIVTTSPSPLSPCPPDFLSMLGRVYIHDVHSRFLLA